MSDATPLPNGGINRLDQKQLEQIPLEQIDASTRNRQIDDNDPELQELAQSIREHGVLQPVLLQTLVHRVDRYQRYQLIAGERRWRAAKIAGLATIPAIVLSGMSEVDAYQLTLIENLQRKNLTPLEEAEEYHKLLQAGSTPAAIAARIGKSVRYVYDRSRLLSLTTEAQELLRAGKMDAGHAVLLARLKPADQKAAMKSGLFDREQLQLLPGEADRESTKPRTVHELSTWINDHVRFDAEPDPMLFPETAATLAKAKEEAEKVVSITHDHFVQPAAKDGTRIFGPHSWVRADGVSDSKLCDRSVIGVIVAGPGRGDSFLVCTDKKKCLVHWGKEIRARAQTEKGKATSTETGPARWQKEEEERKAQDALRDVKRQQFKSSRGRILAAVAERVKKAPVTPNSFLVAEVLVKYLHIGTKSRELVPVGKTSDDLLRCLAFSILFDEALRDWLAWDEFPKRAKALGVDVKKIIDEHEAKLATPAGAGAAKAPAKKKARR